MGRASRTTSSSAPTVRCLYNLANVVDDYDMKITHVIRAEEHLSNTPRQIFIAQGLGYPLPEYAHVPFVAEPGSKNKLSKRKIAQYLKNPDFKKVYEHGQAIAGQIGLKTSAETFNPVIVDFYQQVGYLPDAILNYLVLLGWALDDKTEFFTPTADDRPVLAGARQQGRGQLRPEEAAGRSRTATCRSCRSTARSRMALPYLEKAGLAPAPRPRSARATDADRARGRASASRPPATSSITPISSCPTISFSYDEKAFEKRIRKPPDAGPPSEEVSRAPGRSASRSMQ